MIDFDAVTRNPQKPANLSAAVDGGDHLHPGPEGYRIMAGAIELRLFGKSSAARLETGVPVRFASSPP